MKTVHRVGWVILAGVFLWRAARRGRGALRGKTVLVTGASRGLGLLLTDEFAKRGANVVMVARDGRELARGVSWLEQRGRSAWAVRCDLTDEAERALLLDVVQCRFGHIDVLVNNAGVMQVGPEREMSISDYRDAMALHFWAPLELTRAVLAGMREHRDGRIVNISSIGGIVGLPHLAPYAASKFALTGFSQALHAEVASDGISVTTVCPGLMRTGSTRHAWFTGQHRREQTWFSLLAALPVISMSARSAARRIARACERRRPFVVLGTSARIAARLQGLSPVWVARALRMMNRLLLPAPPSRRPLGHSVSGRESTSAVAPSWMTMLNDRAARAFNEIP